MFLVARDFEILLFSYSPQWGDFDKRIPLYVRSDISYKQLPQHWIPDAGTWSSSGDRVLVSVSYEPIGAPVLGCMSGLMSVAWLDIDIPQQDLRYSLSTWFQGLGL